MRIGVENFCIIILDLCVRLHWIHDKTAFENNNTNKEKNGPTVGCTMFKMLCFVSFSTLITNMHTLCIHMK